MASGRRQGARVYADVPAAPGDRLEIECLLPDGEAVSCSAEVVEVDRLPASGPAPYDVVLRLVDVTADDIRRLGPVLRDDPMS